MAVPSSSSPGAQVRCYWCTSATAGSSLLSTKVARPLSWAIFCFLVSWRTTLPFSHFLFLHFLLQIRYGEQASNRRGRRGKRRLGGGGWDFGASLEDDLLFLPTRRSFKPFLELNDISSSSSSELSSIFASTRLGVRHLRYCQTRPPGLICG